MDEQIQQLKTEIKFLKQRNEKVDKNKAWETSTTRKIAIAIITYIFMVVVLYGLDNTNPFISAFVATLGFIISTLSLDIVRKIWER